MALLRSLPAASSRSKRCVRVCMAYCLFVWLAGFSFGQQASSLEERLSRQWETQIIPLMNKHCGDCHLHSTSEGGVNFDDYTSVDKIREHSSTWEQVRGVIRAEAMPPPDASAITLDERTAIIGWIESALHEVDCGCQSEAPDVTLRRLNQTEYDNTIRDLFGQDLRPSKQFSFVSDDVGNGFDNQGEVLSMPTIVLEKYIQSAAWISNRVIETNRESFRRRQFERATIGFGESVRHPIHAEAGKYRVEVQARFGDKQEDNCRARLTIDGVVISEWDVAPKDETYKYDCELTHRDTELVLEYIDDAQLEKRNANDRRLNVESIRMIGPEGGQPRFPIEHERLVVATPELQDSPDLQPIGFSEAARRVFSRLLPRIYRRNASDNELQSVVMVCERAHDSGFTFEESLQYGLQAALVSPQFLFRSERLVQSTDQQRLNDHGLATRLSYFLWSSMPDAELFEFAERGELHNDDVLLKSIQRMLDDPKADALQHGFFAQWLGLRNLSKLDVDRDKFPIWSVQLREALLHETELFCQSLVREGKIQDLLSADYTFINPRLADFYGVPFEGRDPAEMLKRRKGRNGPDKQRQGGFEDEGKWVRVSVPANRKGLLTQGAVLALTSNPTRTSPVKRGKWILDNVLGDPPPSAPPNVPSLEKAVAPESASLRERLEIHRSNPSCAGCHKLMDPIGLGLENFDVIGRWREKDGESKIETQGTLSDGRNFSNPSELVQLLTAREESIARNFASRLLTYALGRGLQRVDKCDVDRILEHAKPSGYAIRTIIEGVVLSDAFRQRASLPPNSHLTIDPSHEQ